MGGELDLKTCGIPFNRIPYLAREKKCQAGVDRKGRAAHTSPTPHLTEVGSESLFGPNALGRGQPGPG